MKAEFVSSFAPLAARYDAFILDLWGVIHDGQKLYPGAKDCLERLRGEGKKIVLLSNAPRRAAVAAETLQRMGIKSDDYDALITSGEAAYQCLAFDDLHEGKGFCQSRVSLSLRERLGEGRLTVLPMAAHPSPLPEGEGTLSTGSSHAITRYIYIGLERDRNLLEGLHYRETDDPDAAHFLLLAHSYFDNQPLSELTPLLSRCLAAKLPALCVNPDSEVVRQTGERVYCAGVLAGTYAAKGGRVIYFGKPHPIVYEMSLKVFAGIDRQRILTVGDNLATDILGAGRTSLKSALVTGGILREEVGEAGTDAYADRCNALFAQAEAAPDYVLAAFNWMP